MATHFKLPVFLLMFLLLLACANQGEKQKAETLNDAINEYAYALRWGRIDDALTYHINDDGSRPDIDVSIMKFIRVTGFTIKQRTINPDQTEATVESELNYYHDQYGTLKSLEYIQLWLYMPDVKKWLLSSEFPKF
jgi:hypothetical protein